MSSYAFLVLLSPNDFSKRFPSSPLFDIAPLSEDAPDRYTFQGKQSGYSRGDYHCYSPSYLSSWPFPWINASAYATKNSLEEKLSLEIEDFCRYMSPTRAERRLRVNIVARTSRVIRQLWPQSEIRVFGSSATNLYLPQSDMDLCVFNVQLPPSRRPLFSLEEELRCQGLTLETLVVPNAKVPLVKMAERDSRLQVDISFNVSGGPANTRIIKQMLQLYPLARPLTLVLKGFLTKQKLHDTFSGGLGSYCLVLMVISHLQMYQANFDRDPNAAGLGRLLLDFFELYGVRFRFERDGISVLSGGSYFNKVSCGPRRFDLITIPRPPIGSCWQSERGWMDHRYPMVPAVEDPQNPASDVGRNSFNMSQICHAFEEAHEMLSNPQRALSLLYGGAAGRGSSPRGAQAAVALPATVLGAIISLDPSFGQWREVINALPMAADEPRPEDEDEWGPGPEGDWRIAIDGLLLDDPEGAECGEEDGEGDEGDEEDEEDASEQEDPFDSDGDLSDGDGDGDAASDLSPSASGSPPPPRQDAPCRDGPPAAAPVAVDAPHGQPHEPQSAADRTAPSAQHEMPPHPSSPPPPATRAAAPAPAPETRAAPVTQVVEAERQRSTSTS
ncbi:putative DNA polymerase sigma subunit [Paratrimastix pyriformis]|uniref:DNA polymerase sigma subunit n=1 Tax=Paratrimastix pyriformis TaxID=342808 RepID=A0ABQ8U719_9EUKA|nr:putative DNA polymerase sigma subunit [Paratrimastix pyriformis]